MLGVSAARCLLQRLLDGARNEVLYHVMVNLFAEPLLDDRRRNPARAKAGQPRLLRVSLDDAVDLGINNVARDLDSDRLLGCADVLEFSFHLRRATETQGPEASEPMTLRPWKIQCERRDSNPVPFRSARSKSASASSATFASTGD